MQKKYFNNLNGIRFILATMVLIHHVAILLFVLHISNLYNKVGMLKAFGPVAVSLFFALSGFLITNILLTERQNTGTVSLKKFYLSRALRILPLYYFILIIHFYILPHTPLYALDKSIQVADIGNYLYSPIILPENLLRTLYFLLLPQIALALSVATANKFVPVGHVWSIGVEEIFYFIYPILLKKFGRHFKKLMIFLLSFYYGIGVVLFMYIQIIHQHHHLLSDRVLNFIIILFLYNRVNCMFIGAIGAYLFLHKHRWLAKIDTKIFSISVFLIIVLFCIGARVLFFIHELYCILFVIVLLYFTKYNKKFFLENRLFSYLGKISYGIYMYQMLVIYLVVFLYLKFKFHFILVYPLSIIGTIFLAAISYELFEKKILKLKPQ